ncbi:hypothetical protein SAMD00019534_087930, partial [Acytostelium subglobosum LB1]|uniref:hypothetical protein n=1 Tax=Acytostelium subglobosum LB1 TaxID=1410327 RepID=UPI000644FADF
MDYGALRGWIICGRHFNCAPHHFNHCNRHIQRSLQPLNNSSRCSSLRSTRSRHQSTFKCHTFNQQSTTSSMIVRHVLHVEQVPYDGVASLRLQACRLKIDLDLKDVKEKLNDWFTILEPGRAGSWAGNILSLGFGSNALFSLETSVWRTIDFSARSYSCVTNSVVYAHGNIYVFGGYEEPQYSRYSIFEEQEHTAPMTGLQASINLSACYNGDKYIYLFGGDDETGYKGNQVDRFNIFTHQFESVGTLPFQLSNACTHFHKQSNSIIVVCKDGTVHSFNLNTLATALLMDPPDEEEYNITSCFDGHDNLYMLAYDCDGNGDFYRYKLSTKEITILSSYDRRRLHQEFRIIYHQPFGIMLVGGYGYTLIYSVDDDEWSLLDTDNDEAGSRGSQGACLVLE